MIKTSKEERGKNMNYLQFNLLKGIAEIHNVSFKEIFDHMKIALNEADIDLYEFLDALL